MMLNMKPLPLPVRIAAGLVATAVEQVRCLPRLVVEFPVTAVSQALQTSMHVQQKVTELAIKGDRVLSILRPIPEEPSWATFDDEEPGSTAHGRSGTVTTMHQGARDDPDADLDEFASEGPDREDPADIGAAIATSTAATATASAAAGEVIGRDADDRERTDDGSVGPNIMPGYPQLSIPQLRGRLRQLSVEDLRLLLDWEIRHENRPPFVTMLSNRIATITEG
ncbi:lipid droplet-associated protein [Pseudonocardia hispaniensis]|uniref:Lipid droplet-associated protein n=1 Tax=Pseudonocardia hispaniensis TaxID=904933 RepID=A0ABW1IZJ3_9PSEU